MFGRSNWEKEKNLKFFPFDYLKKLIEKLNDQEFLEHVSLFFYENPDLFKIYELIAPKRWKYPDIRMVLDYQEDFIFLTKIFENLYGKYDIFFGIEEIIECLNANPKYLDINKNLIEKSVR